MTTTVVLPGIIAIMHATEWNGNSVRKKGNCKHKNTLSTIRLLTFPFYTDSKNIFLELY